MLAEWIEQESVGWTIWIIFQILPFIHVLVSPRSGSFRPPPVSKCPVGPRVGWLVIVLLLGLIGWIMYMRRRSAHAL